MSMDIGHAFRIFALAFLSSKEPFWGHLIVMHYDKCILNDCIKARIQLRIVVGFFTSSHSCHPCAMMSLVFINLVIQS